MTAGRPTDAHPCMGTWKVLESSSRFLPVSALLRVEDRGKDRPRAVVEWPDTDPAAGLELFGDSEVSEERLFASFEKKDPHSTRKLACFFSMVRQPRATGKDLAYGTLIVEGGDRGDSSTGTFVAEETDTEAG